MRKSSPGRNLTSVLLIWVLVLMPIAVFGQTKVSMPKNKYKIQDDVKIGNEYSGKVEQQFPMVNDYESARYIEDVGRSLVNSIPREFQQSAFRYRFKIVNARDINAFALPGGPMYVNRGLIEIARNEGEMAGVMAHEISHVALRHGTAQATKQSSLGSQLGTIGLILGGAILGGQAGAQLGAMFAAGFQLKYSRQYENQADVLGARIMANAGYDPIDLANMFKTIAGQSEGGRPPEWLSSHPDPDKRYQAIRNERNTLRVSPNPIKITRGFTQVKQQLASMPKARTMAEIEKDSKGTATTNTGGGNTEAGNTGGTANNEMSTGRYSNRVPLPSYSTRVYQNGNLLQMRVPSNWRQFGGQNDVWFSPEGAFGNQGITHGAVVGIYQTQQRNLQRALDEYVKVTLKSNTYLRQTRGYSRTRISGRTAYATMISGRSPVTGNTEYALIYGTWLQNGNMLYFIGVAPERDSYRYNGAFNRMVRSIQLNPQA